MDDRPPPTASRSPSPQDDAQSVWSDRPLHRSALDTGRRQRSASDLGLLETSPAQRPWGWSGATPFALPPIASPFAAPSLPPPFPPLVASLPPSSPVRGGEEPEAEEPRNQGEGGQEGQGDQEGEEGGEQEEEGRLRYVELPPRLHCPKCGLALHQPRVVHGCGHECCLPCVQRAAREDGKCPMCERAVTNPCVDTSPSVRSEQELAQHEAFCQFTSKGCDVIAIPPLLHEHTLACPFSRVPCPEAEFGCRFLGSPAAVQSHIPHCAFHRLRPFTEKTRRELSVLRERNAVLRGEAKRAKALCCVVRARAERRRVLLRRAEGLLVECPDQLVVRVVEPRPPHSFFTLSPNAPLAPVISSLSRKHNATVTLSCDGPLDFGGAEVKPHQSPFDLGLLPSSPAASPAVPAALPASPQFHATLYVQIPQQQQAQQARQARQVV